MSNAELAKQKYEELLNNMPYGAKLIYKEGLFWNILHWIVFVITFGSNKTFKDGYCQTFGKWICVPTSWKSLNPYYVGRLATLKHELIHVKQYKTYGLGSATLGMIPVGILYLLIPIPIGFAWFRWLFEREAYVESIKTYKEFEGNDMVSRYIERCVTNLTTGQYAWTMPFPNYVRNYFINAVGK